MPITLIKRRPLNDHHVMAIITRDFRIRIDLKVAALVRGKITGFNRDHVKCSLFSF